MIVIESCKLSARWHETVDVTGQFHQLYSNVMTFPLLLLYLFFSNILRTMILRMLYRSFVSTFNVFHFSQMYLENIILVGNRRLTVLWPVQLADGRNHSHLIYLDDLGGMVNSMGDIFSLYWRSPGFYSRKQAILSVFWSGCSKS